MQEGSMVRASLLALVLLSSPFSKAFAQCNPGVPIPSGTTLPVGIILTGESTTTPAATPYFTITMSDDCGQRIANRYVKVDLSACGDFQFSAAQEPGVTADCGQNIVKFSTDVN